VALPADSGLRISEALRLRIEDVNFAKTSCLRMPEGAPSRGTTGHTHYISSPVGSRGAPT
jgi:integrase